MKKIIELPERFATGEPTMVPLVHWTGGHHVVEKKASVGRFGVS